MGAKWTFVRTLGGDSRDAERDSSTVATVEYLDLPLMIAIDGLGRVVRNLLPGVESDGAEIARTRIVYAGCRTWLLSQTFEEKLR